MRPTAAERSRWRTTSPTGIDPQPHSQEDRRHHRACWRERTSTPTTCWAAGRGEASAPVPSLGARGDDRSAHAELAGLPAGDLADLVQELTTQMHAAAADLQFELAARLRDEIADLKKELRQMVEANR